MDNQKPGRAMACGLALGLALGLAGVALGATSGRRDAGDHYEMGWTVLVGGKPICTDPFVRPSEREIECRSARPPP
jgi:hypothetical protein